MYRLMLYPRVAQTETERAAHGSLEDTLGGIAGKAGRVSV